MNNFEAINLIAPLLHAVERQGFTEPTAIQAKAIPQLMEGRDMIGVAQTGGGKTAAFVLPLLQSLMEDHKAPRPHNPKAIILAPTRELALQIGECIRSFTQKLPVRFAVIYGGTPYRQQMKSLSQGTDILVATPGRLLDHVRRGTIKFKDVTHFILDEADRMLDMGFIEDVQWIAGELPEGHQSIMFSATMEERIKRLADQILNEPVLVEVEKKIGVATTIDHRVMFVAGPNKRALLYMILEDIAEKMDALLIFTKTKAAADKLSKELDSGGIRSECIHGDRPQAARERSLKRFKKGVFKVLVATDVAARGIDVSNITHVINYDMPMEAENYIHRVGRTGRAGKSGIAISFCDGREKHLLNEVEKLLNMPVFVDNNHPHVPAATKKKPRNKNEKHTGHKKHIGGHKKRYEGKPSHRNDERPERKFKKRDDRPARQEEGFKKYDDRPDRQEEGGERKFKKRRGKPFSKDGKPSFKGKKNNEDGSFSKGKKKPFKKTEGRGNKKPSTLTAPNAMMRKKKPHRKTGA